MKYIDSLQNKINYHLLGAIFIIFTSCSLVKDVTTYSYYRGGIIQDDTEMLLFHIDSSYIFSNYSYGEKLTHREIGQYQIINDTIILYPQIETGSDRLKSFEYKGEAWYSTIRSDSVYAPPIKKRFYKIENNYIKDITLECYFSKDSNAVTFYETYPLYKIKIMQKNKDYNRELSLKKGREYFKN